MAKVANAPCSREYKHCVEAVLAGLARVGRGKHLCSSWFCAVVLASLVPLLVFATSDSSAQQSASGHLARVSTFVSPVGSRRPRAVLSVNTEDRSLYGTLHSDHAVSGVGLDLRRAKRRSTLS